MENCSICLLAILATLNFPVILVLKEVFYYLFTFVVLLMCFKSAYEYIARGKGKKYYLAISMMLHEISQTQKDKHCMLLLIDCT